MPEPEYTFKHALTHEVAYGSLLQAHRRALHARIGEALERLYSNRLAEHTERLAHHAFQGEVWDKAAAYALQAGRRAGERSAVREEGRYGEQGLGALARLPPSSATLELALHLRHLVYHMLFVLGEDKRLAPWAEESVMIADRLGDNPWRARSRNTLANALWFAGNNAHAVEICEQAQALAEAIDDVGIRITTALDMGHICRSVGDYRRGADALGRAVDLLQGDLARDRLERALYPFVTIRSVLSHCLAELGEFPRASTLGWQAISFAESVQQPGSLANAASAIAFPLLVQGAFAEAIPLLERALETIRQSGIAMFYPVYAARLGQAYAIAGRPGETLGLFQDALARAPGLPLYEISAMLHVVEGYLFAGRQEDALVIARRALDLARARSERGSAARALWLLGELASKLEVLEVQQAEACYRQALALAEPRGMRPLVAHCHLGLGKLSRRTGKREQAQEHLTTATAMYREMDMRFWLEQAETEMKQLGPASRLG